MFPTYDMNPIAIHQMGQERLSADIDQVDGRKSQTDRAIRRMRAAGVVAAFLIVAAALV